MNYKNAFKCHKCPQSNGEDGCPAWNEIIMTNIQTGEDKITKGCTFQLMPFIMTEAIKASNTSANTFAAIKNEIARGYALIAQALPGFAKKLTANVEEDGE
jgi:hypothetical protein